jgi:hypothetical protein
MNLKDTRRAAEFGEILGIIHARRMKAFEAVNVALIDTYWAIGEQLSRKVSDAGWGKGVVAELAAWLAMQSPDLKGFSASNLWRMKQFYETYVILPKLATLLRDWSINELSSCEATYFWMRAHSRMTVSVCGGHLQLKQDGLAIFGAGDYQRFARRHLVLLRTSTCQPICDQFTLFL